MIWGKLYSAHSRSELLSFKTKNFPFLEATLFIWVSPVMGILYNFDWIIMVLGMKHSSSNLLPFSSVVTMGDFKRAENLRGAKGLYTGCTKKNWPKIGILT